MASETIHIRFSDKVDGSQELAREAADIAFNFSGRHSDRQPGESDSVGYVRAGHVWTAYRTKAGAVVVRCERKAQVPNG